MRQETFDKKYFLELEEKEHKDRGEHEVPDDDLRDAWLDHFKEESIVQVHAHQDGTEPEFNVVQVMSEQSQNEYNQKVTLQWSCNCGQVFDQMLSGNTTTSMPGMNVEYKHKGEYQERKY